MMRPSTRPYVPIPGQGSDTERAGGKFEILPPFVPGRSVAHEPDRSSGAEPSLAAMNSYPPIEDFLDSGDGSDAGDGGESYDDAGYPPPIEHFMDSGEEEDEAAPAIPSIFPPLASGEEPGWGQTDWQGYDWRSAGALGEGAEQARDDWAATDWHGAPGPARDTRQSAAQAIAAALDQIAERIRSGELSVPSAGLVTDQATIAATLAALLGVRR